MPPRQRLPPPWSTRTRSRRRSATSPRAVPGSGGDTEAEQTQRAQAASTEPGEGFNNSGRARSREKWVSSHSVGSGLGAELLQPLWLSLPRGQRCPRAASPPCFAHREFLWLQARSVTAVPTAVGAGERKQPKKLSEAPVPAACPAALPPPCLSKAVFSSLPLPSRGDC